MKVSMVEQLMQIEAYAQTRGEIADVFDSAAEDIKNTVWRASTYVNKGEVKAYLGNFLFTQQRINAEFQTIRIQAYTGYLKQATIESFLLRPNIEDYIQNKSYRHALLKENFELLRLIETYKANVKQTFCLIKAGLQTANDKTKKRLASMFESCQHAFQRENKLSAAESEFLAVGLRCCALQSAGDSTAVLVTA